jgi:hypothetical protein
MLYIFTHIANRGSVPVTTVTADKAEANAICQQLFGCAYRTLRIKHKAKDVGSMIQQGSTCLLLMEIPESVKKAVKAELRAEQKRRNVNKKKEKPDKMEVVMRDGTVLKAKTMWDAALVAKVGYENLCRQLKRSRDEKVEIWGIAFRRL